MDRLLTVFCNNIVLACIRISLYFKIANTRHCIRKFNRIKGNRAIFTTTFTLCSSSSGTLENRFTRIVKGGIGTATYKKTQRLVSDGFTCFRLDAYCDAIFLRICEFLNLYKEVNCIVLRRLPLKLLLECRRRRNSMFIRSKDKTIRVIDCLHIKDTCGRLEDSTITLFGKEETLRRHLNACCSGNTRCNLRICIPGSNPPLHAIMARLIDCSPCLIEWQLCDIILINININIEKEQLGNRL